jgi:hypothetical protein
LVAIALLVFETFRVPAAVEFDNRAPLATDEVDIVAIDGLLSDEFEAAQFVERECVFTIRVPPA